MPTDVEKAYAKKHKLNDFLNELYSELIKSKPDNPIEFAIKHLESKLPPKKEDLSSLINFKISKIDEQQQKQQQQEQTDQTGNDLLKQLFMRRNLLGVKSDEQVSSKSNLSENYTNANLSMSNAISPFVNLNIMNKINRIIVKTNKELTNEEILEKENIVYLSKNDDNQDTKSENKQNKAVIRYKNDLKNREMSRKHKQELRNVIEKELAKKNETSGILRRNDFDDNDDDDDDDNYENKDKKKTNINWIDFAGLEEGLEEEILTTGTYNLVSDKKEKKKKNKNRQSFSVQQFQQTKNILAPIIKLIICQNCSKIQNNLIDEENDFSKKEYLSVNERTSQIEPSPRSQPAEIVEKVDEIEQFEQFKQEEEIQAEKTIFDFFRKSMKLNTEDEQPNNEILTGRKTDNFDDEIIESASQVSGPRRVEQFDPITNRSLNINLEGDSYQLKETGILDWIMSRQRLDENIEDKKRVGSVVSKTKSESSNTLVGSKVVKRETNNKVNTSRSSSRVSDRISANLKSESHVSTSSKNENNNQNSSNQHWKVNLNSSSSELSATLKFNQKK